MNEAGMSAPAKFIITDDFFFIFIFIELSLSLSLFLSYFL